MLTELKKDRSYLNGFQNVNPLGGKYLDRCKYRKAFASKNTEFVCRKKVEIRKVTSTSLVCHVFCRFFLEGSMTCDEGTVEGHYDEDGGQVLPYNTR